VQLFIGLEYGIGDKAIWYFVPLFGGVFIQIVIGNIYRGNREAVVVVLFGQKR